MNHLPEYSKYKLFENSNFVYANTNDHDVKAVYLYNLPGVLAEGIGRLYLDPELTKPCSAEYGLELFNKHLLTIVDIDEDTSNPVLYNPCHCIAGEQDGVTMTLFNAFGVGPAQFACLSDVETEGE